MRSNNQLSNPNHGVTAIVPAFNEAKFIGTLLDVLVQISDLSQIIVVDDCSTDATAEIVSPYICQDKRVHLLHLPKNLGKGGALTAGAQTSDNDLVVFLDADLINIQPSHILDLIEPIRNGTCLMALGIFKGGRWQTDFSHRITPFLSGQRCLYWSEFKHTPELAESRWGAEVALSLFAWKNQLKVEIVPWIGVTHVMRPEKTRWSCGFWSHVQMWVDIIKYLLRQGIHSNRPRIINIGRFILPS